MRLLEQHEYPKVGGAGTDTLRIYQAEGVEITSQLELNNSTTITFKFGAYTETWNSAQWVTCDFILGPVSGFMVTTVTGNPALGFLAGIAANAGCSAAFSQSDEDGDEYGG